MQSLESLESQALQASIQDMIAQLGYRHAFNRALTVGSGLGLNTNAIDQIDQSNTAYDSLFAARAARLIGESKRAAAETQWQQASAEARDSLTRLAEEADGAIAQARTLARTASAQLHRLQRMIPTAAQVARGVPMPPRQKISGQLAVMALSLRKMSVVLAGANESIQLSQQWGRGRVVQRLAGRCLASLQGSEQEAAGLSRQAPSMGRLNTLRGELDELNRALEGGARRVCHPSARAAVQDPEESLELRPG